MHPQKTRFNRHLQVPLRRGTQKSLHSLHGVDLELEWCCDLHLVVRCTGVALRTGLFQLNNRTTNKGLTGRHVLDHRPQTAACPGFSPSLQHKKILDVKGKIGFRAAHFIRVGQDLALI